MENKIQKENIIFIALVYNYLANQKLELEQWNISKFLDVIYDYLKYHFQIEVVMDGTCDAEWNYFYDIIKEIIEYKLGIYRLKTLEGINYIYSRQPEEVIKATLQEDALSCIDVIKENLEIETRYRWISDKKGIYTLEGKNALNSIKRNLEESGCRNIQMGYPIPAQLEGDKGFYVSYTCQEPIEKVNVLKKG